MKKVVTLVLILLFIPILVNASSFNSASGISKKYINNFLNPDRYIKTTKGDLISKEEVELTIVRKDKDNKPLIVSSYMFDGTKFWAKEAYIIGEEIVKNATGDAKTKVTEIVKHETKVKGTGKYNDPWMFVDSFKVTVKSNGHGTIDGIDLITKSVYAHGSVSFVLEPDAGYKYLNNTCGMEVAGSEFIVENVEKDMVCYINFETSKYSNTLPVPYKVVHINLTNSDVTYRFDNAPQGPVPNTFSSRYLNGYYTDDTLTTRLGKLKTLPSRKGWTFKGYYVGDKLLVSDKGYFETTYSILKDNSNSESITFKIEENKYKITFNKMGGSGGTSVINNWPYEHDMPVIEVPGRPGYVFEGYYTKQNGTGDKYYDANGNELRIFNPNVPGDLSLFANWTICPVGSYCPGDNSSQPCPSGYSTASTGSYSCTQCRYWDPCHTGENTCRWGCDTYCYKYSYQCGEFCYHLYVLAHGGCYIRYCSGTSCSSYNCSDCHSGHNTCKGDWVYIQSEDKCVPSTTEYTVNLDKNGGTGGTNSYQLIYYGTKPVAVIDGDKDKETISIPTKPGYVFDGYYTSATGGTIVIDKNYKYSSSYNPNKNDYTNAEMNNLITEINGKIVFLDLQKKASPIGKIFTLYAHWTPCPKGSRCPGDNKEWLCTGGQYQNETAKTTCKTCIKESYQGENGSDKCNACIDGSTNLDNGLQGCNELCSNSSEYVKEWETAVWNDNNTVTNACKIKSCVTGYHLENNKCVQNKVTIKFKLGSGEHIKTPTSNSSGSYTWTTDGNGLIYLNGKLFTQTIGYGGKLGTNGLVNYNNDSYMSISKSGYKGEDGAEWVNVNNTSKKYNQNTVYNASDFCDLTSNNCEVTLSVNWVEDVINMSNAYVTIPSIDDDNTCRIYFDYSYDMSSKTATVTVKRIDFQKTYYQLYVGTHDTDSKTDYISIGGSKLEYKTGGIWKNYFNSNDGDVGIEGNGSPNSNGRYNLVQAETTGGPIVSDFKTITITSSNIKNNVIDFKALFHTQCLQEGFVGYKWKWDKTVKFNLKTGNQL